MAPTYLKDTNPNLFHFLGGTNLSKRHQSWFYSNFGMAPTLKYSISYGTNLPKRHQPWNILFFMTPILILFNFLMTPIYLKDTNPDSFHFLDGTNLPKRHQPRFIPFSMTPTCLKDTNPNLFHFTMAPTCLKDTKPDLFFWMAKNEKWIKSRLVSFRQVGAIQKLNKIVVGVF